MFNLSESREGAGLSKALAICATGFMISLGLCGVNYVAVMAFKGANFLIVTGIIELAGMILFGAGIAVIAIIFVGQMIFGLFSGLHDDGAKSDKTDGEQ